MGLRSFYCFLLTWLLCNCSRPIQVISCDVLVIGEGTGAVAAAIQSARSGARTVLANPLAWLGGMLTSAGVSAVDGNHHLAAGLWGEFRQQIENHYGGPDSVSTGWVSNTLFEPHVGAAVWQQLAAKESNLTILNNIQWSKIKKQGLWRVEVVLENGQTCTVEAKILIDGTDLGDVAAAAGAHYDLGMDTRSKSGEAMAPETSTDIVQDLTYTAILKNFGTAVDKTIPRPAHYDSTLFLCACRPDSSSGRGNLKLPAGFGCGAENPHPCSTMLSYAKLPKDKYLLNWPLHGNDYYADVSNLDPSARLAVYHLAKEKTLAFVYFIQHELGYQNLGLADDEFPTHDHLPLIPYHREGRRIHGMARLTVNHILNPYDFELYKTGIAVGDYPIDHHHKERPDAPVINFPAVPSFNIPAGCLIPKQVDHLLVADKAISVTNIVNGASRLQPVIIQVGQAAGLMAALSAIKGISPKNLDIRQVQTEILKAKGYIMPFYDVRPGHQAFEAIQRVGSAGLMSGTGEPYGWANRTWFYPDSLFDFSTLPPDVNWENKGQLTRAQAAILLDSLARPFEKPLLLNP